MRSSITFAIMGALAIVLAACVSASAPAACDRACLTSAMNTYLAALQSGDLAHANLAGDFRATRNGVEITDRRTLSHSIAALGDVQRIYADPVTQQAAYLGLIEESAGPALTAIRIRLERGRVTESEQFIAHQGDLLFSVDGFRQHPPRASRPASAAPPSREAMIAAANAYFEALTIKNGSGIPHVPGCDRLENGTRVTNRTQPLGPANEVTAREVQAVDCAGGMERMTQIRAVAFRRFPLVDEQAGVVMGVGLFLRPPGQTGNFARRNLLTEFFEQEDGKLSGIYAVMHYLDADAPDSTGWPSQR